MSAPERPHPYAEFLPELLKPARYVGGEVGTRSKPWTDEVATFCLAFPDVYDIGMSHLGFKILYGILNDDPRTLAERCYAPWVDLEAKLRERGLPLVSLESRRPLKDFDVVGFSLQFELTYSNILNMLDLGGIPLRAVDRGDDDPLVVAGGPVATHPEPIAPFLDAIVIGDGEEKATELAVTWKRLKREGVPRAERLREIAKLGAVYVPALYATSLDEATGLHVVSEPSDASVPFPIERSLVDLDKYPFPDESPTGGPEAIFDRVSIEIARGCTEGCRFCQAGMIYRPVRERDPEQIVETIANAVKKSGSDEVSLTALSTADVSCISPLIKKVSERLARERVSLSVASLRAYGLEPELLDELRRVRAAGLTFAPEAGTQRMRDVINKNVTEEQLLETAERVFSRGWGKMKLYFILGLPTETDEDVLGIAQTGARALAVGKKAAGKGNSAEVTVSVSVHVPKPHTPFQWCAMDSLDEVERKQRLLKEEVRKSRGLRAKTHDATASVIEGVFARGDRPLADVLERAWRLGARFDSWDDQLKLDAWRQAFDEHGVDTSKYLGTMPVSARLPWSHIDVGLEDGFLAREYRKALASRLSPPCGKVAGTFVHPTNVVDAKAETRRLVCYDCGVACDLTMMREERVTFLERLGALEPTRRRLPLVAGDAAVAGNEDVSGNTTSGEGVSSDAPKVEAAPARDGSKRARPKPAGPRKGQRVRLHYTKTGPMALLGHLDLIRELPRVFRRTGTEVEYTAGFHPKPDMTFTPALSLGIMSLDEIVDLRLMQHRTPEELDALARAMTAAAPAGLVFRKAVALEPSEPGIGSLVRGSRYAFVIARRALRDALSLQKIAADPDAWLAERAVSVMALSERKVRRDHGGLAKMVDVRSYLEGVRAIDDADRTEIDRAALFGDITGFVVDARITGNGAARPVEMAEVLFGDLAPLAHQVVRLALVLGPAPTDDVSPIDAPAAAAAEEPVTAAE
jgi:radical SAM family uncharacterized protein/radical SAM-linked protein